MAGPSRAVIVLSITQILGWGALFYTPTLLVPLLAEARGWSLASAMLGFSVALGISGLVSPIACRMIDRVGGRPVMAGGALAGALGLGLIPFATHPLIYGAAWILIGTAMASILYDPAFTALARIFGSAARRPITFVTFAGGFASTVSWPMTHVLIDQIGWRDTYFALAAILALVIAPLHAFALPPPSVSHAPPAPQVQATPPALTPGERRRAMVLLGCGFAAHAFILSGLSTHLIPIVQRGGVDATTAVFVGALFGPSQVVTRLAEFLSGGRTPPLRLARMSMAAMAIALVVFLLIGISTATAIAFAVAFGAANGVITIARGALPLAMFGATGYGGVIGRIARPAQVMQAFAPFALAFVIDLGSDRMVLELMAALAVVAFVCFGAIRPRTN